MDRNGSHAHHALVALQRTATGLVRRMDAVLEPFGVTSQQYNVLRILRGARGPLPTLEIGERMVEQTPGVTRLIDRLIAKNLVERRRCPGDRRVVHCVITDDGLALLAEADAPFGAFQQRLWDALSEPEMEQLEGLLRRIGDRLD